MAEDFEYLDASRVDEETLAAFTFDNVQGFPVFECAPAIVVCNRAYQNALVAALRAAPKKKKSKNALPPSQAQIDAEEHAKRLRDAELFATTCVRSWIVPPILRIEERPDGAGGTKRVAIRATYSPEATRAFLENLATRAPHVFDAFRFWISQEGAFQRVTHEELEEEAGNSGGE